MTLAMYKSKYFANLSSYLKILLNSERISTHKSQNRHNQLMFLTTHI